MIGNRANRAQDFIVIKDGNLNVSMIGNRANRAQDFIVIKDGNFKSPVT